VAAPARSDDGTPTIAVVGGGITGLSAAWSLATSDSPLHVVVLEGDVRFGGKIRGAEIGGRPVDVGPDAFVARRPEGVDLCRQVGLGDELVAPGSRNAYVWARARLRPLPAGLALGVPTRLGPLARSGILSPLGLGRAAVDLLRRPPTSPHFAAADRAVDDVVRGKLGREVADRLADPLIGGIHAGPTAGMSAAAVFPPLLEASNRGGSLMRALRNAPTGSAPGPVAVPGVGDDDSPVFLRVRGGMNRLTDQLVGALRECGVALRTGSPVERIEHRRAPSPRWQLQGPGGDVDADGLVVAVPADVSARLLAPVDAVLADLLAGIAYADVTLVTLRCTESDVGRPLDGTGFLVPADGRRLVTACTWLSSKWPELRRPGEILLRASAGRYGDDRASRLDDDELVVRVVAELAGLMELRGRPIEAVVTRWPGSFPQYAVGHRERVAAIEDRAAALPCLALAGAALRGVGIPACIASGRLAAATVGRGLASADEDPS